VLESHHGQLTRNARITNLTGQAPWKSRSGRLLPTNAIGQCEVRNTGGSPQSVRPHWAFSRTLPAVLVTLHRHANAKGYFSPERFTGRIEDAAVHELALNPDAFTGRTDEAPMPLDFPGPHLAA